MIIGDDETLIIEMVEGDYGLVLPITLQNSNIDFSEEDQFSIKIFKEINTNPILEKVYSNISNNTIEFSLTQEESVLLPKGKYYYDIDWFQENSFLGNLVRMQKFNVLDKAGGVNDNNV